MASAARPYSAIQDPRTHKILVNAQEMRGQMEARLGYSYSAQYLRRLTNHGKIPATKFKGIWLYDADQVIAQCAPGINEQHTTTNQPVDWL